ncbi:MAG: hypothetical protein ABJG41_08245 [Cyclobacteriaceae bacterium]
MSGEISRFHKFWVKLTQWEYWPLDVLYFPVKIYFIFLAIKNRSFFFFTSANPVMEFGGLTGERKSRIHDLIPQQYLPTTRVIDAGNLSDAKEYATQIGFPLIAKPDIGERGKLVEQVLNEDELEAYVKKCPVDFLIQELVAYPIEVGVFYMRHPNEAKGRVTSVVQKDFLAVTGDGKSSVRQLLSKSSRAALQLDFEHERFRSVMAQVPGEGETVVVEAIGNHCRGTTFLNRNDQIDDRLEAAFDKLSKQIDGFHYGRYDLRCASFDDLRELKNFKIVELNGAAAEPAHIYQPGFSLFKAYGVLFWHYSQLSKISAANRRKGIPYWKHRKGMNKMKAVRAYNRLLNKT